MLKATLVNQRSLWKQKSPVTTLQQDEWPWYHLNSPSIRFRWNTASSYANTDRPVFVWCAVRLTMDKALIDYVTCNTGTLTHITGMQNKTHIHSMNLPVIFESSHNIIWWFDCESLFSLSYFSVPAPGLPSGIPTRRFPPDSPSLWIFLPYYSRSRPFL